MSQDISEGGPCWDTLPVPLGSSNNGGGPGREMTCLELVVAGKTHAPHRPDLSSPPSTLKYAVQRIGF